MIAFPIVIPRAHKDDEVIIQGGTPYQQAWAILAYIDLEAKEIWAAKGMDSLEDNDSLQILVPFLHELIQLGANAVPAITQELPKAPNALVQMVLIHALSDIGGDTAFKAIEAEVPRLPEELREFAQESLARMSTK